MKKDENDAWQIETLSQHRNWTWSKTSNIDAFYQIAILLCDNDKIDDIKSDFIIHDMKKILNDYIKNQKILLSNIFNRNEKYVILNDIIKIFNFSCVFLIKEHENNIIYDSQEIQVWMNE